MAVAKNVLEEWINPILASYSQPEIQRVGKGDCEQLKLEDAQA